MADSRLQTEQQVDHFLAETVAANKKNQAWNITKKVWQEVISAGFTFCTAYATFVPSVGEAFGVSQDALKFVGDQNELLKNAPTFLVSDILNRSTAGFDTGVEKLSGLKAALARSLSTICTVGAQIGIDQCVQYFNAYPENLVDRGAAKAAVAAGGAVLGRAVEAGVVACAWKKEKGVRLSAVPAVTFAARKQEDSKTPLLNAGDDLEMQKPAPSKS